MTFKPLKKILFLFMLGTSLAAQASVLHSITPGDKVPDEINVFIEIPANSDPIKYEMNKETGTLFVDRFMMTAMFYPCNYGYIPQTLSGDGDPVDVLVITPFPLMSGTAVKARPIGMLKMTDEAGQDYKILAVPTDKSLSMYTKIKEPKDLPPHQLQMISHFFKHYKDLEKGKWVKLDGWVGTQEAKKEILSGVHRYQENRKSSEKTA